MLSKIQFGCSRKGCACSCAQMPSPPPHPLDALPLHPLPSPPLPPTLYSCVMRYPLSGTDCFETHPPPPSSTTIISANSSVLSRENSLSLPTTHYLNVPSFTRALPSTAFLSPSAGTSLSP